MSELVNSLNKFSFHTLQSTNSSDDIENSVFSPYSAFVCVAMSISLFEKQTRTEILNSLQICSGNLELESFLHQLFDFIDKENTDKVSSSNRIWANQNLNFHPETFAANAKFLGIPIEKVTFPEPACSVINEEVYRTTKGMISKLVDPSDLGPESALVLLNAIYFKSNWDKKFDIDPDESLNFTLANGTQIHAKMIQSFDRKLPYAENANFQVVSIPYMQNQYDYVVILPKDHSLAGYEALTKLTYEVLNNELLTKLQNKKVNVKIPKFSFESKINLKKTFKSLGMNKAFTESADCIDPVVKYYVSSIIQKAKIVLDENVKESDAATEMIMNFRCRIEPEPVVNIFADHPFAFLLRHKQTGSIIFEGFVKNPQE